MLAVRSLESSWRNGGAGANFAYLTQSIEDDLFHKGATHTQFKQNFEKLTSHKDAYVVGTFTNAGAGKNMTLQLPKTSDFLGQQHLISSWYGIRANGECGCTQTSWVNARGLFVYKSIKIKIATQTLFEGSGELYLILAEMYGILDDIAKQIGFAYTKEQLIEESQFNTVLYTPNLAYPGHERPDLYFAIGTVAYHPVVMEVNTRSIHELVVNYDGVQTKGKGMYSLPIEIDTSACVSSNSVDFALAANMVWVSPEERLCLLKGYNETIFVEYQKIGEHTENPNSCNEKKVTIDLNVKGPVTEIFFTVQSCDDLDAGNWVKTFDNYGLDYITEAMLITGSTAREDGLPASFYRTVKYQEAHKVSQSRAVYVFSFQKNATSRNPTGHQTMTNVEKLQLQLILKSHKCPLSVNVYAGVYNGTYTDRGVAGIIWG